MAAIASFGVNVQADAESSTKTMPFWQPVDGDVIKFDVLRKGKPFGHHIVSFEKTPEGLLRAVTDVELKVSFGPIKAFRYDLDSTETWRDGTLVTLEGDVNDNGNRGSVSASGDGAEINIDGTVFSGTVASPILPSSHWNMAQVHATRLLSTEDGEIIDVAVSQVGTENLTVNGQQIEAMRYRVDTDIDFDLWYDNTGRWVKLSFEARNQTIEYVLTERY